MEHLSLHLESLLFVAGQPVSLAELMACLSQTFETEFEEADIINALEESRQKYLAPTLPFEIVEIGGGYQFMTKPSYHSVVANYLRLTTRKRLSQAALETLAIIAYKQPISKSEVEQIRGVNCDYSMQKLLEKELVFVTGRSEGPGRPLLYGTSEKFMHYFGLRNIDELPKPKEFATTENAIGEPESGLELVDGMLAPRDTNTTQDAPANTNTPETVEMTESAQNTQDESQKDIEDNEHALDINIDNKAIDPNNA